jgi:UDP-N-acetylmuramoyl-L-alanyl-D-glutamate--2,6-diaminopimelate ligase
MKLSEVLRGLSLPALVPDVEVAGIASDSRRVGAGFLFVAIPGTQQDGLTYAREAVQRGAVALVAQSGANLSVPCLVVPDARDAVAIAAANFYRNPARELLLLGVTGTNGKTTTTYLVESIARAAGKKFGVVGTVSYRLGDWEERPTHTTPDAIDLQALFRSMRDRGADGVVMEVSSHALDQRRVAGVPFRGAAFTNLTQDHLDYHHTMDAYFTAKRRLFVENLDHDGVAVVNGDDERGSELCSLLRGQGRTAWAFSRAPNAATEIRATQVRLDLTGDHAILETPQGRIPVHSPLIGAHNLENILAATGLGLAAGFDAGAVERGIAALANVPGRLERVSSTPSVFVDYAHSPDALQRVLDTLVELGRGRRLIAVFGCGGDRDRGKRPLMGAAVGERASLAIVTSDNPRSEDAGAIIAEILPGLDRTGKHAVASPTEDGYHVEVDRRKAIAIAIRTARPEDVVLIAGKGHEDYQIVGSQKLHFDDREEARRFLGGA